MLQTATRSCLCSFARLTFARGASRSTSVRTCRAAISTGYLHIFNSKKGFARNSKGQRTLFTSPSNTSNSQENVELGTLEFEKISNETLESLTDYFDVIIEEAAHLKDADVSYGDGVLTVKFGDEYGTYVINRQTPNKQIWLSSPTSGPKRYDYVNGKWIYKHDGKGMHELLNEEIPHITKSKVAFNECSYSGG